MGKAMTPIGVIADLIVSELGDNTGAKKFNILQHLALCYQHMALFLNQDVCIKTEIIPMDGNQFELPCDFIYETKVGIRKAAVGDQPPSKTCVLHLNTGLQKSYIKANDTDTFKSIYTVFGCCCDEEPGDMIFYNSPCGPVYASGTGFHGKHYYNIENGVMNISPFLHSAGEQLELIVEYKSDALSGGISLVPAEAFNMFYFYGRARYFQEGEYGTNQVMYESQFKTLSKLYNFRPIDVLVELFSIR